jgi:hypothetical protein
MANRRRSSRPDVNGRRLLCPVVNAVRRSIETLIAAEAQHVIEIAFQSSPGRLALSLRRWKGDICPIYLEICPN